MQANVRKHPKAVITSDASGNWGCGVFSSQACWFQLNWKGQTIRCTCDNVVIISSDKLTMHILRCSSSRLILMEEMLLLILCVPG